jgi:hypothetical protein
MIAHPESEAGFTAAVIALAKLHGWRVAHFRPARTARGWRTSVQGDGVGFPDLVMCRGPRLLVVELKAERGSLSAEQKGWLAAFGETAAEVITWKPRDWNEIKRVLGSEP